MPQQPGTPNFLERLAVLEDQVAQLRRSGWERDELPFYPTYVTTIPYIDSATYATAWETVLTPRTASLSLGIVAIGDAVGGVYTGGSWQVRLAGTDVVMSGSVPPTFAFQFGAAVIDLAPYQQLTELKVEIQARRTAGATTGGRFGGGGSIGIAPRYARLL